jgi:hypothetical protein
MGRAESIDDLWGDNGQLDDLRPKDFEVTWPQEEQKDNIAENSQTDIEGEM